MLYHQTRFYDEVGKPTYAEEYDFMMNCELFVWANDKMRTHYYIPINDPNYKANFKNTVEPKATKTDEERRTIFFRRTTDFRAQIESSYHDDLNGLRTY